MWADMKVVPYSPTEHQEIIKDWLNQRDIDVVWCGALPAIGLIAFEEQQPIAVGFLRRCEGDVACMDSFLTNPKAESSSRHTALDLISEKMMQLSKELKVKYIWIITKDANTIERAQKHGSILCDYTMLIAPVSAS